MNQKVHSAAVTKAAKATRAPTPAARKRSAPVKSPTRTNDPERTMADILAVASTEFAEKGLAGGRIDEIAAATHTSKRMIYYYFGSKEGLYLAVLEDSYRRMRSIEARLELQDLEPMLALRRLVEFTFDRHQQNPGFVRLVMSENIHRGEFLAQSRVIQEVNVPAIEAIRELCERGAASGVFRRGIDPIDLHATISALAFFNVSNAHTFGLIFKRDPQAPANLAARRKHAVDLVMRFVRK